MGLFLYTWYFIRSVYYRGLMNTVRLLAAESRYERFFNIHTMQIKASSDPEHFHYQGASYYVLLRLFKELPGQVLDKTFIDYGCGKGRALFCAEYCGFNELLGVELDKELLDIAAQNLQTYSKKREQSHFRFVHANAAEFEIPAGAGVFYFFNPFSDKVMEKVADKIAAYRDAINEPVYIIYLNPKYQEVWTNRGFNIHLTEKSWRYTEAVVYVL